MAGIRIVPFMGMLPRVAERLLGDGAAVEAGSRPMPTLDELLAELPVLTWPN